MLSLCFKEQSDFILDRSRRKSARCPRRAGKSYACLILMCRTALQRPGAVIQYICLTRGQAKKNLWRTLKQFNDTFELDLKFHETNITATFPNNSIIEFMGGETRAECEKFRGQSFDLCVLDEGKSFQFEVLEELIEEVLNPALADRLGTLALIGTPGNILAGPFFEATSAYEPNDPLQLKRSQKPRAWARREEFKRNKWKWNWSFHNWHTKHNVAMPHIWEEALLQKENRSIVDTDPTWQREWMGEWCSSESLMVYAFSQELNTYSGSLPDGHDWQYLLGLDLGYNDSTAIVVNAFSDTCPEMYQVHEYKEPELTFDQIEKQVRRVLRKFPDVNVMVADTGGLGKTIIESLRERGLAFEAAIKTDKLDHIELVNSDLRAGKVKLLPDSHLAAEMRLLQWTDKTYKKEAKGTDNHLCDANLYLIRYAYHHFWEPAAVVAEPGSTDYWEEFHLQEESSMLEQHNRINNDSANSLDSDFGGHYSLDGEKWTI